VSPNVGAGAISMHPIDRHVALDHGHKLMGYYPQRWLAHDLPRAVVFGQCVLESDFFIAEARFLAASARGPDILGKSDQFFQNLANGTAKFREVVELAL
jgi:hypothetical protein